ncbi:MAG: type IV toxin-antitoxin system AbiEi family antitoxin domain-containing protein, partial [Actinomycetota bacterium]
MSTPVPPDLTSLPPSLRCWAQQQDGVFTTAQALRAGIVPDEITALVRRGRWARIRRGSYALGEHWTAVDAVTRHHLHVRAVTLSLRAPAVVSHHSAAVLLNLRLHELPLGVVHVTHPLGSGSGRRESDVHHHEATTPDADRTQVAGMDVTTPVRTALDVARVAPTPTALALADGVLWAGATHAELLAMYESQLDWPGSRGASRVVALADGRSDSVGETLGRWALSSAGVLPDVLQHEVRTDLGVFRTDYAWLAERVVGEFDGMVKYGRLLRPGETTRDVLVRERRRELAIERAGWVVVRFTWSEL